MPGSFPAPALQRPSCRRSSRRITRWALTCVHPPAPVARMPECGARQSLLLASPMLICITDLEIDRGTPLQRSMLPLSNHKAQFLDALCVASWQAEGARGRGRGRGRGRRRRFHEEEEEAGMTLEEWEAQQGDQSMSCPALMYRLAPTNAVLEEDLTRCNGHTSWTEP